MGSCGRVRGAFWRRVALGCGCAALVCLGAVPVEAQRTKRLVAMTAWERAEAAREAFETKAPGTHTRVEFTRLLDEFRVVYHENPAGGHAPEAVNAVAELLVVQGRELGDAGSLRAAVGQYEFLRVQYPGSRLREPALLAEARIERDDLGDERAARERFQALVREAPRSESAKVARAELATIQMGRGRREEGREGVSAATASGKSGSQRLTLASVVEGNGTADAVPMDKTTADSSAALRNEKKELRDDKQALRNYKRSLAAVTGIRHWSTPTYTRVAIDLGDEVTFEAARVPHPDRIYFDLHGARLAAELVGKSFDVTDDGFLKRIRAAQAGGDVTRVVLDVNDVTEYTAFLLPNPYRLIIDIHGGKRDEGQGIKEQKKSEEVAELPVAAAAVKRASAAANSSGLPPMAVTDGGEAVRVPVSAPARSVGTSAEMEGRGSASGMLPYRTGPEKMGRASSLPSAGSGSGVPGPRTGAVSKSTAAKPVPNTVTVKAPATTTEVAAVSEAPGKVEATSAPTSKPIAALVKTRDDGRAKDDGRGKKEENGSGVPRVRDVTLGANAVVRRGKTKAGEMSDAAPAKAAEKTADGETSMIRALGLKIGRIVIDAGHGGHDSGTLGVDGIEEKDVVLDVALRLGKLLHERLGAEIIYTRSDDTFIPLETRTAIANKAQADLFLSIHANSSEEESARGVETYYLNFTSDATALDVAARENAVSGQSIHQLSDLVKKIALKDKIAESREFAADVEGSLYAGLRRGNEGLKDRGVKKAPFVVLIGANMPSILAEISFVTNARDAAQLREPEYRERVAESLYAGVAKYAGGLAGLRAAPAVRAAVR